MPASFRFRAMIFFSSRLKKAGGVREALKIFRRFVREWKFCTTWLQWCEGMVRKTAVSFAFFSLIPSRQKTKKRSSLSLSFSSLSPFSLLLLLSSVGREYGLSSLSLFFIPSSLLLPSLLCRLLSSLWVFRPTVFARLLHQQLCEEEEPQSCVSSAARQTDRTNESEAKIGERG